MWYHFAFVAVSVALFGLTVGALIVYLLPRFFADEATKSRLFLAALLFSVSIVVSFVIQVQIPFTPEWTAGGISSVVGTYLIISVPFIWSGVAVSLALTRFPKQISTLYAADLVGAGLGTVALIWLLAVLQDGPSAVLAVAALAGLGALFFGADLRGLRWPVLASGVAVLFLALAIGNGVAARDHDALLDIRYVKGETEAHAPLYEKWNAFSRVLVGGNPDAERDPFVLGLSSAYPGGPAVRELAMTIDASAGTIVTKYNGDPDSLGYLKYDTVHLAHYLRNNGKVAIIGTGGGRDILAALAFGQRSITAIEMNGAILEAVNEEFGDFTGHLDQQPGVRFVNDEARSHLSRTDERFDLIQIPFIDTWAATAAGAFALSENGLYTVDAWGTFLDRLEDDGILSVSRWFYLPRPMEAYRLVSLAAETLRQRGIENPRDHIMLVRSQDGRPFPDIAVTTILVSPTPFSTRDTSEMERVSRSLDFEPALLPGREASDPLFAQIAEAEDVGDLDLPFPGDISAPTDDRPFFFQMIGFRDIFNGSLYGGFDDYLVKPVLVLVSLALTVIVLTVVFIIGPLALTAKRSALRGTAPYFVFFAAIGLAFLLIEISQMQRLIIFLGHPTHSLSVVLFSLLLSSGVGSLATERLVRTGPALRPAVLWPFAALIVLLLVFGFTTPAVIDRFDASTTPVRILASVGILAPMGLLMGMPFPVGMKVASLRPDAPTPFFWGINGATSVCASVLAVAVAMGWGISTAFWAGLACYAVAAVALGAVVMRGRA